MNYYTMSDHSKSDVMNEECLYDVMLYSHTDMDDHRAQSVHRPGVSHNRRVRRRPGLFLFLSCLSSTSRQPAAAAAAAGVSPLQSTRYRHASSVPGSLHPRPGHQPRPRVAANRVHRAAEQCLDRPRGRPGRGGRGAWRGRHGGEEVADRRRRRGSFRPGRCGDEGQVRRRHSTTAAFLLRSTPTASTSP